MKPQWIDIHIKAKTDAPLKLVRHVYKLNREVSGLGHLNYYDIEVYQATVKRGKEGR